MKGREKIFFPSSTSRLSSRAAIFTRTRVYCSLIIPEVDEGPKLTKSSCSLLISLFSTVNSELKKLYLWLASNKLALNTKKTHFVIFHPYQKSVDYLPQLKIFDTDTNQYVSLEMKNYVKYLGILIDKNL